VGIEEMAMATKDRDSEDVGGNLSRLGFLSRRRKGRGDKKNVLKVQLCHAMDQITIDVEQVIELNMRELVAVRPTGE
jgi:hypothetical protein